LLLLPLNTWLMKRIDHRTLIMSGLMVTTFAFYRLSGLSLQADYGAIVKLRILESSGVALFLTPISVLAFSQLKTGKNDAAASLYGLFRNLGSAIGISVVNTMLVRDVQVHRTYLVQNLSASSTLLSGTLKDRASYFSTLSGDSRTDATVRALGWIHEEINRQALLLCYIDCFRLLMYVSLALSPVAIFFAVRKRSA